MECQRDLRICSACEWLKQAGSFRIPMALFSTCALPSSGILCPFSLLCSQYLPLFAIQDRWSSSHSLSFSLLSPRTLVWTKGHHSFISDCLLPSRCASRGLLVEKIGVLMFLSYPVLEPLSLSNNSQALTFCAGRRLPQIRSQHDNASLGPSQALSALD